MQDFIELRNEEPDQIAVLDVREPGEIADGTIENAICISLGNLRTTLPDINRDKLLVDCKGGYRSSIATSILRRAGYRNIANLIGGFDAWQQQPAAV